ncbi:MAG: polysaccharide deacetylase family protein [Alphaproteobacteria bacterium]
MVPPATRDSRSPPITFPAGEGPYLLVMVDAEEEFDWATFSSSAISVGAMRHQERAQRIFDRHGLVPTYVVDYPVATQPDGYRPLREFFDSGRCEIGSHLHPWVNPPIEEEICVANSFPGNLPARLEREKLRRLTGVIEDAFGVRPVVYRAGRYGSGPNTAGILADLGYRIDSSVLPLSDQRPGHGPDYRTRTADLHWFGPGERLLEIPVTADVCGLLGTAGRRVYPVIAAPLGRALRVPAVLARLRLVERIVLSPEGVSLAEAKRLTRALLARGHRVFLVSYHSPSLEPGHTPYVRSAADLETFLAWLEGYVAFFLDELGGSPSTPGRIRARAEDL